MAEYYGYAEKDASSQVNWAEIGKNLSDTIQEGYRIRGLLNGYWPTSI